MTEVWIDIVGYENEYSISDIGNVISKPRKFVKNSRLIKKKIDKDGYVVYCLCKAGESPFFAKGHRLVAIAFLKNPLHLKEVNHKNAIKTDNRVENLEWCTGSENRIYAKQMGLYKANIGSFRIGSNYKISQQDRDEIRRLRLTDPKKNKSIFFQRKFNVSKSCIYSIVYGKT
jgi:hypothetical protein